MYVVYHTETTVFLPVDRKYYASSSSAKAALTRAVKNGVIANKDDYAIAEEDVFHNTIEKTKVVRSLGGKKRVELRVNTPHCCDPSTETYWSM